MLTTLGWRLTLNKYVFCALAGLTDISTASERRAVMICIFISSYRAAVMPGVSRAAALPESLFLLVQSLQRGAQFLSQYLADIWMPLEECREEFRVCHDYSVDLSRSP
jgi:hypothetical protein